MFLLPSIFSGETITILHLNDNFSQMESIKNNNLELNVDDKYLYVESGGILNITSKINELRFKYPNSITLHSGNFYRKNKFSRFFHGETIVSLMNLICFDALSPGSNYSSYLKEMKIFIDFFESSKCKTSLLDIDFKSDLELINYIDAYKIIDINGKKYGIIGSSERDLNHNNNKIDQQILSNQINLVQKNINDLTAQNVHRIILLSNLGYLYDLNLALNTENLDIIVGSNSNTILGNFDSLGIKPNGPYPSIVIDKNGDDVCIVNAWEKSQILGELNVDFDNEGNIVSCSGIPHLILENSIKKKDKLKKVKDLVGKEKASILKKIEQNELLSIMHPNAESLALLNTFKNRLDALANKKIGYLHHDICITNRDKFYKFQDCNQPKFKNYYNMIMNNFAAKSLREFSSETEIAITQGSITNEIFFPKGEISYSDIYKLGNELFSSCNNIVSFKMKGHEIVDLLEDAHHYAISNKFDIDRYPYASGLKWDFDQKSKKITNLKFKSKAKKSWNELNQNHSYIISTNDIIAYGNFGYYKFGEIMKKKRDEVIINNISCIENFVDFVKKSKNLKLI